MFHLFNKVYLDAEWHVSSKYEFILLTRERKEHPLSKVLGFDVEPTTRLEDYLTLNHQGNIENFWKYLTDIQPDKKYIVYLDEDLYLDFLLQYWKSLYPKAPADHFLKLFSFYKKDNLLKSLAYADRGDNHLGNNYHIFDKITDEDFVAKFNATPISQTLSAMNKDSISIEYLLADYFYNENSSYCDGLKQKVLQVCWQNWCANIQDLKAEYIRGFDNLNLLVPTLNPETIKNSHPLEIIKSTSELSWILDEHIQPKSTRYIIKTYPYDFFSKKQDMIDKFEKVGILINKISPEDVHIYDEAAKTTYLYKSDFKSILEKDVQAGLSSWIFNGELFLVVNHVLVNYLYNVVRENKTADLKDFALE